MKSIREIFRIGTGPSSSHTSPCGVYEKTTHIIFPAEITYVDLGNENLVAGLADGATNVLRVKSAFKSFKQETNLSVITEDGLYYQ